MKTFSPTWALKPVRSLPAHSVRRGPGHAAAQALELKNAAVTRRGLTCSARVTASGPLRRISKSGRLSAIWFAALCAWLCLAPRARAQLPNAWQITDQSVAAGGSVNYTNILNAGLSTAATNAGFDFTVNARFVTDYGTGTNTMVMVYGDGPQRWEIFWSVTNGDLVSELITNISPVSGDFYTVTTNGTGAAHYHTHEIIYNPTNQTASYLVDGQVLATNWAGAGNQASGYPAGEVLWGAGSSAGVGEMNFHTVSFQITNGVVAAYDAGTENNPTNAPAPQTQGWTNSPATLPVGTSTNAISPDRGPDVVTTLTDSGYGSLRQIIADAGPSDTITFATNGTLILTGGQIIISDGITIDASGVAGGITIDAGGNSGIFEIASSNVVTLDSLTLTNGLSSDGGAIYIDSSGSLIVNNSTLTGNSATNTGGGIYNDGTLTLSNCVVTTNAALLGGGIDNDYDGALTLNDSTASGNFATNNGGGIYNAGMLTLSNCVVAINSAAVGGGMDNDFGGMLSLDNSGVSGNSAARGGGIENYYATLTLNDSACSSNSASGNGGGIDNDYGSTLALNDSTFSGNFAAYGGGIDNYSAALTLNDSTFSGNSASGNGGAIENDYGGTVALNSSTLSGNSAAYGGGIENYAATLALASCVMTGNSAGNNGGGIQNDYGSMTTLYNSILSGNSAAYGGGIENYTATLIVTGSTLSSNSASANSGAIDNAYGSTLTLNNSAVSGNSAGYGGAIFNYQATLTLNGSSFSGNTASGNGGGIVNDNATLTVTNSALAGNSAYNGGGIINESSSFLTINNSILSNNSAEIGGGIDNESASTLTLNDSTLAGNSAADYYGGGIENNNATLTLNRSTLSGNFAAYGGGIDNEYGNAIVLNDSTFSDNSADDDGGGILNSGTIMLKNSTISGNSATYTGGGIYQDTGTSASTNTIVAGNNAPGDPNLSGSFSGTHNLTSGDPLLAPLGNYGGPTQTMPPLSGSPALDAGLDSVTNLLAADQRGYPRRSGAHVDIGAFEVQVATTNNRPLLANPAVQSSGALVFGFSNNPGLSFRILTSTNVALPLGQWTVLGTATESLPGQYQFADPTATNYPSRFYRAVWP